MYKLLSFVSRGKIRKQILKNLIKPKSPTQLSKMIKTHRSTVSRAILILEKNGLVKCLTPDEKMCRFYETTKLGKKILARLKDLDNTYGV